MLIRKIEEQILDQVLSSPSKLLANLKDSIYQNLLKHSGHFFNMTGSKCETNVFSVFWNKNSYQHKALQPISQISEFQIKPGYVLLDLLNPVEFSFPSYKAEFVYEKDEFYPIQS